MAIYDCTAGACYLGCRAEQRYARHLTTKTTARPRAPCTQQQQHAETSHSPETVALAVLLPCREQYPCARASRKACTRHTGLTAQPVKNAANSGAITAANTTPGDEIHRSFQAVFHPRYFPRSCCPTLTLHTLRSVRNVVR